MTREDCTKCTRKLLSSIIHFSVISRGGHTIDFRNIAQVGQEHLHQEEYVVHIFQSKYFNKCNQSKATDNLLERNSLQVGHCSCHLEHVPWLSKVNPVEISLTKDYKLP